MIPNGPKIVSNYLREHDDLADTRFVSKTPESVARSWVKVAQLDAQNSPVSRVEHLINYMLQFDCYASKTGGTPEAWDLSARVRDVLDRMPDEAAIAGVEVTSVEFTSHAEIVDPDLEPARERVALTAEIHMHAV